MGDAVHLVYLLCAILFVFGLKMLSSPRTARTGNILAGVAMLLAIIVTLFDRHILAFEWIIAGVIVGSVIGAVSAMKVQMTAMPQMVAIFNGFGGAASALVAFADYWSNGGTVASGYAMWIIAVGLSLLIGTVTFTGSLIAFAKLQGLMRGAPITYKGQNYVNMLLLLTIAVFVVLPLWSKSCCVAGWEILLAVALLSAVLGVLSVIPIGGADMPVVISLLNSYSGLAAAATGFVLDNTILIVSGSLVGASGIILTKIMCGAMNRSLGNVLFAAVGTDDSTGTGAHVQKRNVIRYTADDVVVRLDNAESVIIIPGYGLAVAQAQHVLHEMAKILMSRGIKVRYAIHPVAGRMPGHMNVLLAEANVDYDLLCEMDINEDFSNTDIAMVIGANDVVNPAARYKKTSPLYGMPIFNADYAHTVMIFKRSLGAGFAGEDNELFFLDKTMMVFGDAKKSLTEIVQILKGR